MISVVVTETVRTIGKLIKIFKSNANPDGHVYKDPLSDADQKFMDNMVSSGYVERYVSDWGMQEESYCYTEVGHLLTRTNNPKTHPHAK